jgi:hypothetical protein
MKVQKKFAHNFRTKKSSVKCWWNWHLYCCVSFSGRCKRRKRFVLLVMKTFVPIALVRKTSSIELKGFICWNLGSISPTFYAQLLRHWVYALLVHGVGCSSWAYFLVGCNGKVGHSFVGETEQCRRMPTGAFALCAWRLVKLTPSVCLDFPLMLARDGK